MIQLTQPDSLMGSYLDHVQRKALAWLRGNGPQLLIARGRDTERDPFGRVLSTTVADVQGGLQYMGAYRGIPKADVAQIVLVLDRIGCTKRYIAGRGGPLIERYFVPYSLTLAIDL